MSLISDLRPLNEQEEKDKFFNSAVYNPQFEYVRDFSKQELDFGGPNTRLYSHALSMVEKYGHGTEPPEKQADEAYIQQKVTQLCKKLRIPELEVVFSDQVNSMVKTGPKRITFRTPIRLSKAGVISTLNHEIQTHYLRRVNQRIFKLKSDRLSNPNYLRTEESLATLHGYLNKKSKIFGKNYLMYAAACKAYYGSFRDAYDLVTSLGASPFMAWRVVLKVKRGIKDTSQPGGYLKPLMYLGGMTNLYYWMKEHDLKKLYYGRHSLELLNEAYIDLDLDPILPTFMTNRKDYLERVQYMLTINKLI